MEKARPGSHLREALTMIKAMGANFVRLVHYPHDVRVVDAADRIGLLVSEEPGLWWSDMQNPEVTSAALEVLRRTILRDRSRVSIAFWLAFNECIFTEEYLANTEKLVRLLDPYRAVSGANCMNLKMTKELFTENNWDFYTFHPYGSLPSMVTAGYTPEGSAGHKSLEEVITYLNDKPLVFTEWGGWYVHDNPNLYKEFNRTMASFATPREDGLQLAGMCYWVWNDMYETNRGGDACTDGILMEGLVDIHRNQRTNYYTQADCFHMFDRLQPAYPGEIEIVGVDAAEEEQTVVDVYVGQDVAANDRAFLQALESAKHNKGFFQHKKIRDLKKGPILPYEIRTLGGLQTKLPPKAPLIATDQPIRIPVGMAGRTVWLVGMTVLADAFPIAGKPGEAIAQLTLRYADGTEQVRTLQNGRELCTSFMLYGSSRIDPRAGESKRVASFCYDKNWEVYCINALALPLMPNVPLQEITLDPVKPDMPVLLYGITVVH